MFRLYLIPMVFLASCSTTKNVKRMEIQHEKTRIESLQSFVSNAENGRSDFELFVSYSSINEILSELLPLQIPLEDDRYELVLDGASLTGTYGRSTLDLNLVATDPKNDLEVSVASAATLSFSIESESENQSLVGIITIDTLVPEARWGPWRITFWSFINDILRLEAQRVADKIPPIAIPISASQDIIFAEPVNQRFEFGQSAYITGRVIPPPLSSSINLEFLQSNAYPDGFKIMGTVELEDLE